jgi:hypothetical protein
MISFVLFLSSIIIYFILNYFESNYLISIETSYLTKVIIIFLNSIFLGLALGISGFVFGASVPDESAGSIAVYLFIAGLVLGISVGMIISIYWLIYR